MSDDDSWDPDAGAETDVKDENNASDDDDRRPDAGVKDEQSDDASDDDDDYDRNRLRSFYEEASARKMPGISEHEPQQQLSQASSAASVANLSLAEMSRMDETLLSQGMSHHEEEEERQRKKSERRERRNSGVRIKKPRRPPTEIQIKNQRVYQRFKYKKGTDMSEEKDAGGSMNYLMRARMGERDERRRLRAAAREGEERRKMDEATFASDDDGDYERDIKNENEGDADGPARNDDHGANWNFAEEGYVTMPRADAAKLPYFVYGNLKRKLGAIGEGGKLVATSDKVTGDAREGDREGKRRKTWGHFVLLERGAAAPDTGRRGKIKGGTGGAKPKRRGYESQPSRQRKCAFSTNEPDSVSRSFPLRFHQLKTRMDLHGMVDAATLGPERMVVAHGRNARRLWTRMVAGGIRIDDHEGLRNIKTDEDGGRSKGDDDSMSNVSSNSSSSKSSAESYRPMGAYSQMSYGTTSVIGNRENADDTNAEDKNVRRTPLLRLMSMAHALPNMSHRHRLLTSIAQELGTNRRLWEEELRRWIEAADGNTGGDDGDLARDYRIRVIVTPGERRAIRSFLGVDGGVPLWACDPSVPTHPTTLKRRVHGLRSGLLRRLRRRIQVHSGKRTDSVFPWEAAIEKLEEGADADLEGEGDVKAARAKTEEAKDARGHADAKDEASNANVQMGDSSNIKEDPQIAKEGDRNEMAMDRDSTAGGVVMAKLLGSLMDEIRTNTDPRAIDKYAKVIHESDIDASNIDVALASFLDELTSSKALLRQKQQIDSSDFQHRHSLKQMRERVGLWHETIVSYLAMAETLATPRGANFYKAGGQFPESAPLARTVEATQSYLASSGGVGCGRRRKGHHPSSWEVENGDHSSDGSQVSNPNDDEPETMMSNLKGSISSNLGKKELRGIQLAAKELAKRGRDSFANNHLASFAPIHLTTGVALIVANLTPRAAELASRPCDPDASENRTPFDLVSNMLTSMEKDGSLIPPPRTSWDSRGKVIDEMLVNAMQEAVAVFRKCIQKDPENVDHWSWYVATLLGMLCVAFGAPPSAASSAHQNVDVESEQTERRRLDCFREIRSIASIALIDFVRFSHNRDCPMFCLAVLSMLEWRRAIFLLHHPRSFSVTNDEFGTEVRRLHAYHTYHWASKVCSQTALAKVQQLGFPRDAFIDILARALERNPCERKNWVWLIDSLGSVGSLSGRKGDTSCSHRKNAMSEERSTWWGKGREGEWEDRFFSVSKSATKEVKPEFVRMIAAVVEPCCGNAGTVEKISLEGRMAMIHDPEECMGWIWNPAEESGNMEYDHDAYKYFALLPANSSENTFNSQSSLRFDSNIKKRLSSNPSCEALCMRIVAAGHLLGAFHPFVCDSIWWLSVKLWQSVRASRTAEGNCYSDGIVWLSMHGLDISAYLRCRLKRSLWINEECLPIHELQNLFY